MRSAFALRIISGRTILNFGVQKRLRASACSPWGELSRSD